MSAKTGRKNKKRARRILIPAAALAVIAALLFMRPWDKPKTDDPQTSAPPEITTAQTAAQPSSAAEPTAAESTTAEITTAEITTAEQTTAEQTTAEQTTAEIATAEQTSAAPTNAVPSSKADIVAFFAAAVNNVKNNNAASYDKVEYQKIHDVHMTGNATTDKMIKNIIAGFAKDENSAPHIAAQKGAASSGDNMLGWGLTDDGAVASATLEETGGNYRITVVMADEDTPVRANPRHLEAVGSVTYLDEVEEALRSVPQMNEFSDIHILYRGYTITAELTPEGRLISLRHHTDMEMTIGRLKVAFFTLENKSVTMENNVVFTGFAY